jgi:hypothetical protein
MKVVLEEPSVPRVIGLHSPLDLVDLGFVEVGQRQLHWAIYSDWAGSQALLLGGIPEGLDPGEVLIFARMIFQDEVESQAGRRVRLILRGGGHKVIGEYPQKVEFRIFTLGQVVLANRSENADFFDFYLTGFHWMNEGRIDLLVDGCAAQIEALPEARRSNEHAHIFLSNMLTCVLRVFDADKKKACEVRDTVNLALQVVCGTQVASTAMVGVESETLTHSEVNFVRPMRRPFHPVPLVRQELIPICLENACRRMSSLGVEDLKMAKRVISLSVDAVNQSNFIEVRALIACMAVEELVTKLIRVKAKRNERIRSAQKKSFSQLVKTFFDGESLEKSRVDEACEAFWMVAKSRFDEDILACAKAVGSEISHQEALHFVGFRNALVHDRDPTKNKRLDSTASKLTVMEGYSRVLNVMDKMMLGYFCGVSPCFSRGEMIGRSSQ